MDTTIELLSSMSPKINKHVKPIRKPPTKLALKKYFKKSPANTSMKNESIIIVESNSSSNVTSETEYSNETPIIISDSETSSTAPTKKVPIKSLCTKKNEQIDAGRLSQEKYTKIKLWVNEVNSVKQNTTTLSDVSTICGDDNPGFKTPTTNVAANSTMLESASKRFDELFKNNKEVRDCGANAMESNRKQNSIHEIRRDNNIVVVNDSLITEDESFENNFKNLSFDDSFQSEMDKSLDTSLQKKHNRELGSSKNADVNTDHCEDFLDSLYGNSWREKKEEILQSSEPRPKNHKKRQKEKKVPQTEKQKTKNTNIYQNPYLDDDNSNNLLKTLQRARFKKALESPWVKTFKKICDSETDSEDSPINLQPVKLNFKDDQDIDDNVEKDNDNNKLICPGPELISNTNSTKKVQTKTNKSDKTKKNKPGKENMTHTDCYSFLASLSASVPLSKCNISALIYRNNFKQHKEHLARKLFNLYNESIFDNAISQDTLIEWNDRMRGTAGFCYCKKITRRTGAIERIVKIVLATKVLDSADRLRDTLVHEMCHAATWIVNQVSDGHGPHWRSWADLAMKKFPELPPIKRCHQYVINTKYTYKCTGCGYSIGRHTKSLDTERKRCGYCLGKFEALINKTSKKGETKTVPATPKKPATGFALFVKDNYATYKTPQMTHGNVMKILGQKFAELKCDQP